MADWPATLPQVSTRAGHSERERDNVLRSPMGYGSAKLRERTTAVIRDGTRGFFMTDAQKATLDQFYTDNKALTWTWDEGAGVRNYRFLSPPATQEVNCDLWSVAIQVEIIP